MENGNFYMSELISYQKTEDLYSDVVQIIEQAQKAAYKLIKL